MYVIILDCTENEIRIEDVGEDEIQTTEIEDILYERGYMVKNIDWMYASSSMLKNLAMDIIRKV